MINIMEKVKNIMTMVN